MSVFFLCVLQKTGDSGMAMKYLTLPSKLNSFPEFRDEMNVAFVVEMINVSVLVSVLQLCAHIICQTYLCWNICAGSEGYWMNINRLPLLLNYANLECFSSATCHFHVGLPFSNNLTNTWPFETLHSIFKLCKKSSIHIYLHECIHVPEPCICDISI